MNLTDRIVDRLKSYEDYEEVITTARKNSYGPLYLVGGKIYRTIIEELTGREVGAKTADWDVLVMGDIKPNHIPKGWRRNSYNQAAKPNSLGLEKATRRASAGVRFSAYHGGAMAYHQSRIGNPVSRAKKAHKIDLIAIKDVPGEGLEGYFNVVPLDIQRIALSLCDNTLKGVEGLRAIKSGNIRINSREGCMPGLHIESYIVGKATSIGFTYEGQVVPTTPCNCFDGNPRGMLFSGCKFPRFHT